MRTPFHRFIVLATVAALPLVAPAEAQTNDNRYGAWAPPGTAENAPANAPRAAQKKNLKTLLKDLNALIEEAEAARAANPVFLRDLKALAARYANPWSKRMLFDDFSDGEFQRNPAWSVTSGEYWVEQGYGLRSRIVEAAAASTAPQKVSKEKLALSILGAVLQGTNKDGGAAAPAPAAAAPAKASAIEARARISNAFSTTLKFSSWKAGGVFGLAMNQGLGGAGYRVVYKAGKKPRLKLVRVTARGRDVIDAKAIAALEDQKVHNLKWTRAADGAMTVSIDGKAILSARDASFRDPFDALQLTSQGADVIVKSINVMGAR